MGGEIDRYKETNQKREMEKGIQVFIYAQLNK